MDFNLINNYDGFQSLAPYNDTFFDKPKPLENDEFKLLEKYIKQYNITGNKLLDIGCGTGDLCFYMANCGYNVTGIDYSDNMLLVARNKLALFKNSIDARKAFLSSSGHVEKLSEKSITSVAPKIKFIKNDITADDFTKEQFNLISMINTLSYIKRCDRMPVFKNISNSLYNVGFVIFNIVTRAEFEHVLPIKNENKLFDYEINYDYKKDQYLNTTCFKFYESSAIKASFEMNFIEYEHSLSDIIETSGECGLKIIRIIPNTPIFSFDEVDLNHITESIEATYSMPNGVRSIIVVAQKKQI